MPAPGRALCVAIRRARTTSVPLSRVVRARPL